jgi:TEA/ATTS domain
MVSRCPRVPSPADHVSFNIQYRRPAVFPFSRLELSPRWSVLFLTPFISFIDRVFYLAQAAATGRRGWKTLQGKLEAVWPTALDGALIEGRAHPCSPGVAFTNQSMFIGLEEYRRMEALPTTSTFGARYLTRDQFLSDYIFEKTGGTRTAKQVGSRLQQLWDACEDSQREYIDPSWPPRRREHRP